MNEADLRQLCPPREGMDEAEMANVLLSLMTYLYTQSDTSVLVQVHGYLMDWKEELYSEATRSKYNDKLRRLWSSVCLMASGRFPAQIAPSESDVAA